jgi:succinate dehydrogenase/fumarate reductase flavoprotein subunit
MVTQDGSVDFLVIGGGMAGLTAATAFAGTGGTVALLERAEDIGGSAQFAGFAWTAPSDEVMSEVNPDGDPALRAKLVAEFPAGVEWIRGLGVHCGPAVSVLRYGRGHQFDTAGYISACARLIRDSGGRIERRAEVQALVRDGRRVVGARVRLAGGAVVELRAPYTLLATGGFQADPRLRATHIHPHAADIELRSNPMSDGGGLRLGLAAGGAFGKPQAGFYGHLIPAGVRLTDPAMFVELSLYYSEHALLFDLEGRRFVDETVGDHLTTMALLSRPQARGLLVADAVTYRDWMSGSYVEGIAGIDKFERCVRRGARAAMVDTIEDFDLMPSEWGYPGAVVRRGIEEFNRQMAADAATEPGRRYDRRPLERPPYYVIDAAPAITFTLGGLLIDECARVLGEDGAVIDGLLCAGADAGGLYRGAYAGGIAPALVFGLIAARTATATSSRVG